MPRGLSDRLFHLKGMIIIMILTLFLVFLKIGFLGFGGGYAMLSVIFDEASKFGMTINEFAELNALDFLVPGPIAINSATFVGQTYGGFLGSIVTTLTVSIPSFVFVPLFMRFERKIKDNRHMNSALNSVKAAAVGLIIAVALSIMLEAVLRIPSIFEIKSINPDWFPLIVMIITFIMHIKFKINPVILTFLAAIAGVIVYYFNI